MDDYFFNVFMESIDTLSPEQAQLIANRLHDNGVVSNRMPPPLNTAGQPVPPGPMFAAPPSPAKTDPRKEQVAKAREFKAGDRVVIGAPVTPKYLWGTMGTVAPLAGRIATYNKTVRVNVKMDNTVGRFGNTLPVGIPVNGLSKLPSP